MEGVRLSPSVSRRRIREVWGPFDPSAPRHRRTLSTVLGPLAALAAVLLLVPLSSGNIVLPAGATGFTAGCNLQGPGDRAFGPIGTAAETSHPSVQNASTHLWGKLGHDSEWASSAGSYSWIAQGMHWSIGPSKGQGVKNTPAGCIDPKHNVTNGTAIYKWRLTYRVYLVANCTGDNNASAQVDIDLVKNVHFLAAPWYVFTTMPLSVVFTRNVTCGAFASGNVRTGLLTVTTPVFNLSTGTNYDLYTAVYTVATATSASTASSYASVTIVRADLVRACYLAC